jgi:hypothetical protein
MGRPSTYTATVAALICERLEGGESLREICADIGVSHATVLTWARDNEEFANQYARARAIGEDVDFDRLTDDAAEEPRLTVQGSVDPGWVAWKRLQIDTRKWALGKKQPKKYGDKQQVEHSGSLTLEQMVLASMKPNEPSGG